MCLECSFEFAFDIVVAACFLGARFCLCSCLCSGRFRFIEPGSCSRWWTVALPVNAAHFSARSPTLFPSRASLPDQLIRRVPTLIRLLNLKGLLPNMRIHGPHMHF